MNAVISVRPLLHVVLCEIQGIISSSQKKRAWFLEPEESGFHLGDDSADGVDVYQPVLRPSGGGSLLIVGHIPAEEARVSGAEASLCEGLRVSGVEEERRAQPQEWEQWLLMRTCLGRMYNSS